MHVPHFELPLHCAALGDACPRSPVTPVRELIGLTDFLGGGTKAEDARETPPPSHESPGTKTYTRKRDRSVESRPRAPTQQLKINRTESTQVDHASLQYAHNGPQRDFRPISGLRSVTSSLGNSRCPYGIAYCRVKRRSTSGLFMKSHCSLLCGRPILKKIGPS